MDSTATLTIFCHDETYIFSLALPTEPLLGSQEMIYAPLCVGGTTLLNERLRSQLDLALSGAVAELRRRYGKGGESSREARGAMPLERLGHFLFRFLLPVPLQDAWRELPAGCPIILTTNESLLPWELLHDGIQFLALKHPIGRRLWGAASGRQQGTRYGRSFLFITNPTSNLPEADNESEVLNDLFEPELLSDLRVRFLVRSRANRWEVLQALSSPHELVHFSGHAKPGLLLLADGTLTTDEIQKTLAGRPFVFVNGCWSVREAMEANNDQMLPYAAQSSRTLAEAFIYAGAVGFLGSLWPVFDHSSSRFAEWFYTHIRNGISVGEALRQTREQMYEADPDDPIWASFVLYGDPQLKLIEPLPSETRSVTMLVARLVGLLPLFEKLELEEAVRVRDEALGLLSEIAERYGGVVDTTLTDMVQLYFGVPKAHGNDAEHAILAALEMLEALGPADSLRDSSPNSSLGALPKGEAMQVGISVGISTGRVLVRGTNRDEMVGQVGGVAQALSHQVNAGQIWVDEATHRSTRTCFTFQPLQPLTIGSISKPLYRVLAVQHLRSTSLLIGRESELTQLRQSWRKAMGGRGRVVAIVGAPGVGKTHLVQAFTNEITPDYQCIKAICHIYNQSQSYGLLAQVLRALAKIEPSPPNVGGKGGGAKQLKQLEQLIRASPPELGGIEGGRDEARIKEGLALLGRVVGLPFSSPTVDNLEPALRQKRMARVISAVLQKVARQPLLLVLEDIQWADEASLALLGQIVSAVGRMRLLILAIYRPEWDALRNWGHTVHHLPLEELSSDAQQTLLAHRLGMTGVPEELTDLSPILEQTGGNPFFIEEYVSLLKEQGLLTHSAGTWSLQEQAVIPRLNKLEHVIQARLDQLTKESRQVIEAASIIGDEFEDDLLEIVPQKRARQQLDKDLQRLLRRGLIYELGGWPYFFYTFSHGLVHHIVYQRLPERFRRVVHRLVAQALRRLYTNEEEILSRLAHHYYHSHDRVNAIHYCLLTAKRAADSYANQTALEWYNKALEKIESFETKPASEAEQEEIKKQGERHASFGGAYLIEWHVEALEGQAEVEVIIGRTDLAINHYRDALRLAADLDSLPVTRQADLYRKLAIAHHDKGQFDATQEILNKGLEVLDGLVCLEAGRLHIYTGLIHYRRGRLSAGLAEAEKGIGIIQHTQASSTRTDSVRAASESIRDLAQAYNLQGVIFRTMGESQKGMAAHERSIELYQQAEYLPGLERAYLNLGCVQKDLSLWEPAERSFEQSRLLSLQTGEVRRQAGPLNSLGEIYRWQGKLDQAIEAQEQAREIFAKFGFQEFLGITLMNLGYAYLKKNLLTEAKSCLEESLSLFQRLEANIHLPEVQRYLAELKMLEGQASQAQQLAQKAVELASKLERKLQEAQARRTLGQVCRVLRDFEEAAGQLNQSLTLLEKHNSPYELGLTLMELALLHKKQAEVSEHNGARQQAIAYCERAKTIFEKLGAALDLKEAQEIQESF